MFFDNLFNQGGFADLPRSVNDNHLFLKKPGFDLLVQSSFKKQCFHTLLNLTTQPDKFNEICRINPSNYLKFDGCDKTLKDLRHTTRETFYGY